MGGTRKKVAQANGRSSTWIPLKPLRRRRRTLAYRPPTLAATMTTPPTTRCYRIPSTHRPPRIVLMKAMADATTRCTAMPPTEQSFKRSGRSNRVTLDTYPHPGPIKRTTFGERNREKSTTYHFSSLKTKRN